MAIVESDGPADMRTNPDIDRLLIHADYLGRQARGSLSADLRAALDELVALREHVEECHGFIEAAVIFARRFKFYPGGGEFDDNEAARLIGKERVATMQARTPAYVSPGLHPREDI